MSQSFATPRTLSAARFELEAPRYFWNTPTASGTACFSMDPNLKGNTDMDYSRHTSTRPRAARSLASKLRSWGHRLLSGPRV